MTSRHVLSCDVGLASSVNYTNVSASAAVVTYLPFGRRHTDAALTEPGCAYGCG